MIRAGIDLGGTKIEAIGLNNKGQEIYRKRIATPQGDYPQTLKAISDLIKEMEIQTGCLIPEVGVGVPGALSSKSGLIKNSNSVCLIGQPLDKDLSKILNRPVRLANDANCFVFSEAIDGAASQAQSVFGVIIGTGVGGGFVIDKKIMTGANSIAGEWGHNPIPWPTDSESPGPLCYCSKRGCLETFLSGPGLSRDHLVNTGQTLKGSEIYSRSRRGDPECVETLSRYAHRLARGLSTVINIFDPEVIVLGGGLSNMDYLYERVPQLWTDYVFSDTVETKLKKASFGDSSGVRGAAWLFGTGD